MNRVPTRNEYNSYEEYRSYDYRACEIVNDFLDSNCYPYFTKKFKRTDDFKLQTSGVDCVFITHANKHYICDEKAAIKWSNKTLTTHAFELQFINRASNLHDGWLLAEQKTNTYHLIYTDKIYNDEGDFDYTTFTTDQIKVIHGYIIRKSKLIEYFNSIGQTKEKMILKCKEIRDTNGKCDMGDIDKDGYRYKYCDYLAEQPINILISRDMLDVLADITYTYDNGAINLSIKK